MIKIDKDLCIGCGACIVTCPNNALQLNSEGKCECQNEFCLEYETCISVCPVGAISNEATQDEDMSTSNFNYSTDSKEEELITKLEAATGSDSRDFVENLDPDYIDDWLDYL